ncbi:von Willebrand factor type A domain containing protein [Nitzschia inconspicua]|uniref:26S proteasome regulatory subunit RPN10 n=1 Tax=Nitzschia inconspicua TaxID=303405 RepID=A0A9K3M4Q1_9STRA|nr:von Willebrand factor type A domain containing protein [Nitzschia inconspicua]
MPLESCMILLDNSEFMRNGDYIPTRLEAQQDAANLLVGAKTQSHPESTVGVSAGTELLVSPTEDVGKLLNALHAVKISHHGGARMAMMGPAKGSSNLSSASDIINAIQVASLALKHRRNKNGAQRIVLFVGSPLEGLDSRALAKAGRTLKKNNVAIDVVAMGELEVNEEKLKELVDAANGRTDEGAERTCHLVTIPAGVLPSDVLASSPIVHGGSGGSAFAASAAAAAASGDFGGGANAFAEYGGVDPNMDPELAMALRVSMEEERARQERLAAQQAADAQEESKDAEMADVPGGDAGAPETSTSAPSAMDLGLSEEEALLQQALAMSMNENEPPSAGVQEEKEDSKATATMETEEDDEAAAMQMALQMSLQQEANAGEKGKSEGEQQQFQDPQFVNQLLGSLPGVNPNDPAIQSALSNIKDGEKKEEDKEEGDDGKKD